MEDFIGVLKLFVEFLGEKFMQFGQRPDPNLSDCFGRAVHTSADFRITEPLQVA